jgi:hypothetical protein
MGAENLGDVPTTWTHAYACACNPLTNEPISTVECSWPSVERVSHHVAFLNGPSRQDHQPATKDATVVEFPIGQEVYCLLPDSIVVLLRPALLQSDNVWPGVRSCDLVGDFCESLTTELRDELETPAIE